MKRVVKLHSRAVLIALLLALPNLPALGETEPLMEDPSGIIGVTPTPVGGQTLSLGLGFSRARDGANRDLYGGTLEAEAGLVRGLDLRVTQSLDYGDAAPYPADDTKRLWGGLSQLGLRWQILEEDGWRPALGVFGALGTAYGETSGPSQSGQIVGLLSKTIIEGPRPLALSANVGWSELFNAQPGERAGRYEFAAGITQNLAPNTSVAVSYLRNQQDRGEKDQNIIAAGLWHRLGPAGPIMAAGAGAGIGDDSPSFLLFASFKWLFGAAAP